MAPRLAAVDQERASVIVDALDAIGLHLIRLRRAMTWRRRAARGTTARKCLRAFTARPKRDGLDRDCGRELRRPNHGLRAEHIRRCMTRNNRDLPLHRHGSVEHEQDARRGHTGCDTDEQDKLTDHEAGLLQPTDLGEVIDHRAVRSVVPWEYKAQLGDGCPCDPQGALRTARRNLFLESSAGPKLANTTEEFALSSRRG